MISAITLFDYRNIDTLFSRNMKTKLILCIFIALLFFKLCLGHFAWDNHEKTEESAKSSGKKTHKDVKSNSDDLIRVLKRLASMKKDLEVIYDEALDI